MSKFQSLISNFEKKESMKSRKYLLGVLSVGLLIGMTACSGKTEQAEEPTQQEEKVCFYSYNEGSTEFTWTAFKTPEKVGVPGSFNDIKVESESSDDKMAVLESLSFSMETATVETNNEDRNGKIADKFFGTISTPQITGKVKSIGEDGKATFEVTMNGITKDVTGEYTLEENTFSFNSSIDVADWDAMAGIAALNEICHSLHMTDGQGESKLWSEVDLSFKTTLSSDCE